MRHPLPYAPHGAPTRSQRLYAIPVALRAPAALRATRRPLRVSRCPVRSQRPLRAPCCPTAIQARMIYFRANPAYNRYQGEQ
jgi:hypothetical protein